MVTDSAAVLSGERIPVFAGANVREAELGGSEETQKRREAWDSIIDRYLVEWGRDASALEDEGFIPPGLEVVNLACQVAMEFRDEGLPPPIRVAPDGEGGLAFERVDGKVSESLNIYADQTIELLTFDDCRLSGRHRLT